MRNLKLLSALFAFAIFLVGGSVVYGGLSWTGMDPDVRLSDGAIVNVDIAVPPEAWCLIDGPVEVQIAAPAGSTLVSEQYGPCGVTTATKLVVGAEGMLSVSAKPVTFNKKDKFRMEIMISVDGDERATCSGKSKRGVSCEIDLDDDDKHDDDKHDRDRGNGKS